MSRRGYVVGLDTCFSGQSSISLSSKKAKLLFIQILIHIMSVFEDNLVGIHGERVSRVESSPDAFRQR